METTRRDFLKRAALGGAVIWSAPTITTLPGGVAWADHYQPTGVCDAEATALRVFLLDGDDPLFVFGHADNPADGENCTLKIGQIREHDDGSISYEAPLHILGLRIAAEIACGQVFQRDGKCRALARVVDLIIESGGGDDGDHDDGGLVHLGLGLSDGLLTDGGRRRRPSQVIRIQALRAEASGSIGDPNIDTTGYSEVARVTVFHPNAPVGERVKNLVAKADCNFNLDVLGLVRVIVNEQFCRAGRLTVRALRVEVPAKTGGLLEVVAGEVKVRGAGDCVACS